MSLIVPQPTLIVEGVTGTSFPAASPITVLCSPVTFDDGTPLGIENATLFGYRLYRRSSSASAIQVWNEETRSWQSAGGEAPPQDLFFKDDQWQTILVPLGQTDAGGAPKMETDSDSHYPRYQIRCVFGGTDAQGEFRQATSDASQTFEIVPMGEDYRAGLAMEPDDVTQANEIRLYLKDSGLTERGSVKIRRDGSGFAVELTVSGSSVTLDRFGEITLRPATGRTVQIAGPLNVQGSISVNGTVVHSG